jgi:myo-inositol catabolism protein IolC
MKLYLLPFDHRETFARALFGWTGPLSTAQSRQISEAKQVIYDGLQMAVDNGVPHAHAAILADERFSESILRDAADKGYVTACPAERSGQQEFTFEYDADFARHIASEPNVLQSSRQVQPRGRFGDERTPGDTTKASLRPSCR